MNRRAKRKGGRYTAPALRGGPVFGPLSILAGDDVDEDDKPVMRCPDCGGPVCPCCGEHYEE